MRARWFRIMRSLAKAKRASTGERGHPFQLFGICNRQRVVHFVADRRGLAVTHWRGASLYARLRG
jgi:hypothetical protein